MKYESELLKEYCVGCGICAEYGKAILAEDSKGFYHPSQFDVGWLRGICPAGGTQTCTFDTDIWGRRERAYLGWSTDKRVREMASSGGILTEVASFLLERGVVDGVIHVAEKLGAPTKTQTCISTTREELISRCGSRYAISHPLEIISELDQNKKYVFIGKPCDVDVLNNLFRSEAQLRNCICLTMSFFCAGLPSNDAQNRLLTEMGCSKENCISLRYRGNGWPGFATAEDIDGCVHKLDYDSSWGKILGRDVMPMCRFCLNGIGETADISCGDGWYINDYNMPDFTEHEGRNIVFARTQNGLKVLEKTASCGKIILNDFDDLDALLPRMQYYQRERRQTMLAKKIAMKLFRKPFPKYKRNLLRAYTKGSSAKLQLTIFKGTVSRIIKGRI